MTGADSSELRKAAEIRDAQGVQVGSHNTQLNDFGDSIQIFLGLPVIEEPSLEGGVVAGLVPQRAPAFQPRGGLLSALAGDGPGMPVVRSATGMPGAGKTQLAAAYAHLCINAGWRLVAWVDASDDAEVLSGLAEVASALRVVELDGDLRSLARAVRRRLETDGDQCLLVFDNVTDWGSLTEFLPAAGRCRVIVTSRQVPGDGPGLDVPVDVFTGAEARSFLAQRTGRLDDAGAVVLAGELGCLPLALAQAAALIRRQRLDYATYLDRLRSAPVQDYLTAATGGLYPRGVGDAVVLALDAAVAVDPTGLVRGLIGLIALLSAAGVGRRLLHDAGQQGLLTPPEGRAAAGPPAVDEALGRLAGASLLTYSEDGSAVAGHRLTMRVARERAARDGSLAGLGAGAAGLLREFTRVLPEPWRSEAAGLSREAVRQIIALHGHLSDFPDHYDAALNTDLLHLRSWAIERLNHLGDSSAQAIEISGPLIEDCERSLGPDHPLTMTARFNLAYACIEAERLPEAIALYEQVVAARGQALGPDHEDTLHARIELAASYYASGHPAATASLHERILADCEQVLGSDHRYTLTALNNAAFVYEDIGKGAEAIPMHEQALAGRERALNPDHPETLGSRNNLAHAYQAAGRLDEAIMMFTQSLADHERVLGPEHPHSLGSTNNLARAFQAAGRLPEAISMFEKANFDHERVLGSAHRNSLQVRHNLAGGYTEAGSIDQAIGFYQSAMSGREQLLGNRHPDTLRTYANFGLAYQAAGQLAEAIPLLERALAGREQVLEADHPDIRQSCQDLATAYQAAGRRAEASALLERYGLNGE